MPLNSQLWLQISVAMSMYIVYYIKCKFVADCKSITAAFATNLFVIVIVAGLNDCDYF